MIFIIVIIGLGLGLGLGFFACLSSIRLRVFRDTLLLLVSDVTSALNTGITITDR